MAQDAAPEDAASPDATPQDAARPHSAAEALGLFVLCLAGFWAITLATPSAGTLADLLPAAGVLIWILPAYFLAERRGHDPFVVHGLRRPEGLGAAVAVSLVLLGLYPVACLLAFGRPSGSLVWTALLSQLPYQLVFVALREEYFFRGVLQPALEADEPRFRLLGAPFGRGAVLAALLFALAHLDPRAPNPLRLLTFFPALWFAWLRARTGSILPAMVAHVLANVLQLACLQAWGRAIG